MGMLNALKEMCAPVRQYFVILKTEGGYIFNLYLWASHEDMARDRAKRLSDCKILGSAEVKPCVTKI